MNCAITVPLKSNIFQHIPNEDIPWLYSQMQEDKLLITEDLRVTQKSNSKKSATPAGKQGIISMFVAPFVNNQLWGYVEVDYVRQVALAASKIKSVTNPGPNFMYRHRTFPQ